MYSIEWAATVSIVDGENEITQVAEYKNKVEFDSLKLVQAASARVGEQLFQMLAQDVNVG